MDKVLFVGLGGFLGAVLRYWVGGWAQNVSGSHNFPFGTLAVNLLGCLLMGFLIRMTEVSEWLNAQTRLFAMVGVLGAFTTFSTFGGETFILLRDGKNLMGLMSVGAHLLFGLAGVWAGYRFGVLIGNP
ncbi:MAG: fluoride efflux transporter CrcB [Nitrospiria bacterium]